MAKPLLKVLKLVIPAGKAVPAPPLGPILSQARVNIKEFCDKFNEATRQMGNVKVRVELKVYQDGSYDMIIKTPPTSELIKQKLKINKGSGVPNLNKVGTLTMEDVEEIAKQKLPDLNTKDLEAAKRIVMGTARQMGVNIKE